MTSVSHYKILSEEIKKEIFYLKRKIQNLKEDKGGVEVGLPPGPVLPGAFPSPNSGSISGLVGGLNGEFAVLANPTKIEQDTQLAKMGMPINSVGTMNFGSGMGLTPNDNDFAYLRNEILSGEISAGQTPNETELVYIPWQKANQYYYNKYDAAVKNNLAQWGLYNQNQNTTQTGAANYPNMLKAYDQYSVNIPDLYMRRKIENDMEALAGRPSKGRSVSEKVRKISVPERTMNTWRSAKAKGLYEEKTPVTPEISTGGNFVPKAEQDYYRDFYERPAQIGKYSGTFAFDPYHTIWGTIPGDWFFFFNYIYDNMHNPNAWSSDGNWFESPKAAYIWARDYLANQGIGVPQFDGSDWPYHS